MGVIDPDAIEGAVQIALLERLRIAEADEEFDIFTGELLVEDGRVAPGLSAVVKDGRTGPNIFLYDYKSICEWVRRKGKNPMTQTPMKHSDIILLREAVVTDRMKEAMLEAARKATALERQRRGGGVVLM